MRDDERNANRGKILTLRQYHQNLPVIDWRTNFNLKREQKIIQSLRLRTYFYFQIKITNSNLEKK